LYIGILTGYQDLDMNGFFSGFNNLEECTLLFDRGFSDCYGFTEEEVNNALFHFKLENVNKDKIRKKYGDYSCDSNIGDGIIKNLYNPYSINEIY